jgi:hypothetical protein
MKNRAVFGILRNQTEAEALITELRTKGFTFDDISVLFPHKGQTRDFAYQQGTKAPEGAVVGGGSGGVAGGVLGLLAGLGALAIPGIGPLIAAGPIMAALSGAAVGAAVGSIAGGLVGLGIPETLAKAYEGKVQGGSILISVHTDDVAQVAIARETFKAFGADHISVSGEAAVPGPKTNPLSPHM